MQPFVATPSPLSPGRFLGSPGWGSQTLRAFLEMSEDHHLLDDDAREETLAWLTRGRMTLVGQVAQSWNYVFLARLSDRKRRGLAIYKPASGEYPLWDFPQGSLCRREVAAYRLSLALGWPRIPPSVLRDGPYGVGLVQAYIEADPEVTYFTMGPEMRGDLLPVALFDHLINNADRKAGHLLLDAGRRIWAIDQALSFHVEPKLRTVIWDFAGERIPAPYLADLQRVEAALTEGPLAAELEALLTPMEVEALRQRARSLLASGLFPHPDPNRTCLPWPLV
jgi:uncharacterized repeat protein (TIGR03843 family)